ncbi:agmatinase family protein [Alteribacter natronophilus]|uniref:agmatinase family protein n=1 Tax=Alteribacter natronophilus TaxID=2583810 RepID=UPI00110F06CE|nr:agmatinase family protein [Alteribacter natronophilus]TMW73988.1 agmatinase [Alteribacter natronophilus]
MANDMIYGNTPCFLGAENLVKSPEAADKVDAIIYGVPWEGAVTWGDYTGCELGPKVMRLSSGRYSGYIPELDHIDVFEHLKLGDMGDVAVTPAEPEDTKQKISEFAGKVWESGKFPIALGGDHGITYPIIESFTKKTGKRVGIIHLDAHYDNNEHSGGDPYGRGSPFARLYETEGVRNESLVHLGIHGPRNKPENGRLAKKVGATTLTVNDVREAEDLRKFANEVYDIAAKETDAVYLSICSDVLDHAYNPGGPADGNGLTSYELLTIVHEAAKRGVCGMDFVEVYPQQDQTDFSSHFASWVILYGLAGEAVRRGK